MKPSGRDTGADIKIRPDLLVAAAPIATDGAGIVRAAALTPELLSDLFEERVCALHVPGYFRRAVADKAARFIRKNAEITQWYVPKSKTEVIKTDMAYGIGHPLYGELRESYFSNAVPWMRKVRSAFLPHLSPIDRLRLELDELWRPGAVIPRNRAGQAHFAGLVRVMNRDTGLSGLAKTQGSVHIDDPNRPALPKTFRANCYVSVPPAGGALKIWNVALNKRTRSHPLFQLIAQYAFNVGAQEAIARALPPAMVIRPRAGDLVLFDSGRPHSVTGVPAGVRINIQTFLWYFGRKNPLHIHS